MKLHLYRSLLGSEAVDSLCRAAEQLQGSRIIHINSTKEGGGVAEILSEIVPLSQELGLDVEWRAIQGGDSFFRCTKLFHNLLQGQNSPPPDRDLLQAYETTNQKNAADWKEVLQNADVVFIHDPQPLALIQHFPSRKGKWIWRCHIDLSTPSLATWNYLKRYAELYDAAIFSMKDFCQNLPCPIYFIPPSIDPLSEKNIDLDRNEVLNIYLALGIEPERPTLIQVSRFDRFKDPIGVIQAYRIAKSNHPDLQLVLAGSGAADDPEGLAVLKEVQKAAYRDPDIHILLLPPAAHRTVNALQRGASIVLQKSLKEGFGLTVSEALWKEKPVIGGNCGGIRLQVIDGETGLLVDTIEEAAKGIGFLLQNPQTAAEYGQRGRQRVKERFLITRHLKDYLTVLSDLKKH